MNEGTMKDEMKIEGTDTTGPFDIRIYFKSGNMVYLEKMSDFTMKDGKINWAKFDEKPVGENILHIDFKQVECITVDWLFNVSRKSQLNG